MKWYYKLLTSIAIAFIVIALLAMESTRPTLVLFSFIAFIGYLTNYFLTLKKELRK